MDHTPRAVTHSEQVDEPVVLVTVLGTFPGQPVNPLAPIADALVGAGFPVGPSDDAGDHVCNHLFRHLVTTPALAGRPVGFIHVPDATQPDGDLDQQDVITVGRIVVDTVAAVARGDL